MKRTAFLLLVVFCLSACASQGATQLASNTPPPEGYRETIAAHVSQNFFDPYSVRDASISSPLRNTQKMYWNVFEAKPDWYVCMKANAKNRMGGYTGQTLDIYMFQNGRFIGTHTKPTGAGYENSTTAVLCRDAQYVPFPEIEGKSS